MSLVEYWWTLNPRHDIFTKATGSEENCAHDTHDHFSTNMLQGTPVLTKIQNFRIPVPMENPWNLLEMEVYS